MNYMEKFSLKGKTCVVTGVAATRGIGFALAEAFADAGANLVIADIHEGSLRENTLRLREKGVECCWHLVDTTNRESITALKDFTLERFGRIDVLMNNAGAFQDCAAEDMEFSDWSRVIAVNLSGNFSMAQIFGREMIKQGSGSIIFTSSKSASTVDIPQKQAAYNSSKAGLDMLCKCLAVEWAGFGIRVNCINPGNIITNNLQKMIDSENPYIPVWLECNPSKRFGEIEELGNAAIFLASDASSYVTGHQLTVDGGYNII